ncbi:MAG: 2-pyrone-4,6-dicarboxylate hydrolase [Hyphomicrobiales bacterium]|nr:MAG: 2-pyrone-4,6-dicarboxylate hydrolase [Hyphomicrobiales bacterium]
MVSAGYLAFHPNPKKPDISLPKRACDAHCHVFGPKNVFPYAKNSSYIPVDAPKETLFQRHRFLGFDRSIIVQASCHGTDNAAMIDALIAGGDDYRGVAVVAPDISADELQKMHEAGVRGVRFNFVKRLKVNQSIDDRRKIIEKIAPLGWHVVVYMEPEDLPDIETFLHEIPLPVVIDHMGRLPVAKGVSSPEFTRLATLLQNDKFWLKVGCPERLTEQGPPYSDVDEVAIALIGLIPDQVIWGTDWPHPNMKSHIPDDGFLVDRLATICPQQSQLQALLVDNPDRLYWAD